MQFDRLRRREFITLLGGAAAAWPLAARAQQAGKLPIIGVPGLGHACDPEPMDRRFCAAAARTRLGRGPHRCDRDIAGRRDAHERFAEIAAEFVRLKVDVIVTDAEPHQSSRQSRRHRSSRSSSQWRTTRSAAASSRVSARPGGNVTGLSTQSTDLAGKRLELLREVVPGLRRLAIMANVDAPAAVLEMGEVQAAARTLGLEVATFEIRRAEDIAPAFDVLKGRADALYVCCRPALRHQPDSHQHLGARLRDCRRCTISGSMSKRAV